MVTTADYLNTILLVVTTRSNHSSNLSLIALKTVRLLVQILFANQKSGASGVLCDLGSFVLSQNVLV